MAQIELLVFCRMLPVTIAGSSHGLIEKPHRIRCFFFFVSDLGLPNDLTSNLLYCLHPLLEPFPRWLALTLQALHTHARFAYCGALIPLYPFETGVVVKIHLS